MGNRGTQGQSDFRPKCVRRGQQQVEGVPVGNVRPERTGTDGQGLIALLKCEDVDVKPTTNWLYRTDLLATDPPQDYGTVRPRAHGTVLPSDLREVDWTFDGDVGYHVGPDNEGPAYWRNGQWHLAKTNTL